MPPILSVVVPVYNCAPVIKRCLESIDSPNTEILVVDDGSTDSTSQVVLDYMARHPNVSLIQKENGGVSSARNVGIENAQGKYIMFVDADDYLASNGIEKVMRLMDETNADVIKFAYHVTRFDSETDKESLEAFNVKILTVVGKHEALKRNDIPDYLVWDGIYLRQMILDNNIRFHTDLCLHEDDVFMGEVYCHANKVVLTNLPLYRYICSSNHSSTHNQNRTKQRKLIESGYLAIGYRQNYVRNYCPEALPLERLKYMRWVCPPKMAIEAGYSISEYRQILSKFKDYGCWPLDYNWIHAARQDWSINARIKNRIKTFLCNHPIIGYFIEKQRVLLR